MKPLRAIASLFACAGLLLANVLPAQQFVDTDGDGLYDNDENYAYFGTDPNLADTDGDGVEDYDEIARGLPPTTAPNGNEVGMTLLTPNTAPGASLSYVVYYHSADPNVQFADGSFTFSWDNTLLQYDSTVSVNLFQDFQVTPGPSTLTVDLLTTDTRRLQAEPLFVVDFTVIGNQDDQISLTMDSASFTDQLGNSLSADIRPDSVRLIDGTSEVVIPDPALRTRLETALGLGAGTPITRSGILSLSSFVFISSGNADLAPGLYGLEYGSELDNLYFEYQNISFQSRLTEGMLALRGFDGRALQLAFVNDRAGTLRLGSRGLNLLTYFGVETVDLSYLPPECPAALASLVLTSCSIQDLTPLATWNTAALQDLNLAANRISNLTPLQNWNTAALRHLELRDNQISDLTGLQNWNTAALQDFYLLNNPISDLTGLDNWNTAALQGLYLSSNQISDLSPLTNWNTAALQNLNLSSNQISDLTPLTSWNTAALQYLNLSSNQISNLTGLQNWNTAALQHLHLSFNQISDLTPLAGWNPAALQSLHLSFNQISDLTPLENWSTPDLRTLALDSNRVQSLTPLQTWNPAALRELSLSTNLISDLTALQNLNTESLHSLSLFNNLVRSLSPLAAWDLSQLTNLSAPPYPLPLNSNRLDFASRAVLAQWALDYPDLLPTTDGPLPVALGFAGNPTTATQGVPVTATIGANTGGGGRVLSAIHEARFSVTYDTALVASVIPTLGADVPSTATLSSNAPVAGVMDLSLTGSGLPLTADAFAGTLINLQVTPANDATTFTLRVEGGLVTLTPVPAEQALVDRDGAEIYYAINTPTQPGVFPAGVISLPVAAAPVIEADPTSVSTQAECGSGLSAFDSFVLRNRGTAPLNYEISVSAGDSWLSVNPNTGSLPAGGSTTINITYDIASLGPATFRPTITITDTDAIAAPVEVPVELTVDPVPASLSLVDNVLNVSTPEGFSPANSTFDVRNGGPCYADLNFTATDNANWISLNPASGSNVTVQTVTVSFNTAALAPGFYTGLISVDSNGGQGSVTVNLTVNASVDTDQDGLLDGEEAALTTNPNNGDSDGDGYSDWIERDRSSNPLLDTSIPAGFADANLDGNGGSVLNVDAALFLNAVVGNVDLTAAPGTFNGNPADWEVLRDGRFDALDAYLTLNLFLDVIPWIPIYYGPTVAGTGSATVRATVTSGDPSTVGQQFVVSVPVSANSTSVIPAAGMFRVTYPSNTVELQSTSSGSVSTAMGPIEVGGSNSTRDIAFMGGADGTLPTPTLFTMNFRVLDNAPVGAYSITLSPDPATTSTLAGGTVTVIQNVIFDNSQIANLSVAPLVNAIAGAWLYVDDNWAGLADGADPDGPGPATSFGADSFATISAAVAALARTNFGSIDNGRVGVVVLPGVYAETLALSQAALSTLRRTGADRLVIRGLNPPRLASTIERTRVTLGAGIDFTGLGALESRQTVEVSHFEFQALDATAGRAVSVQRLGALPRASRALLLIQTGNAGGAGYNLELSDCRFASSVPEVGVAIGLPYADGNDFETLVVDRNEFLGFRDAAFDAQLVGVATKSAQCLCQENLRTIDLATEQWTFDKRVTPDQVPTWAELLVDDGLSSGTMPVCPLGGEYTLGSANGLPSCSLSDLGGTPHGYTITPCRDSLPAKQAACSQNLLLLNRARVYRAAERGEQLENSLATIDELVGPDFGLPVRPVCPDGGSYSDSANALADHECSLFNVAPHFHGADDLNVLFGNSIADPASGTPAQRQEECRANLREIASSKEFWGRETNGPDTATPTWSDLVGTQSYLKFSPRCPDNGVYTVNALNADPSCSLEARASVPHSVKRQRKAVNPNDGRHLCQENLLQLHLSTIRWMIRNDRQASDVPLLGDIVGAELTGPIAFLVCPDGGTYVPGSALTGPRCSLDTRGVAPHIFVRERPLIAGIHRERDRQLRCQEYQLAITEAVAERGLALGLPVDTPLAWSDIVGDDKPLSFQPLCPTGGTYQLGAVGANTTCSHAADPRLGQYAHTFTNQLVPSLSELDLRQSPIGISPRVLRSECQTVQYRIERASHEWRLAQGQPLNVNPSWTDLVPAWLPAELTCPGGGVFDLTASETVPSEPRALCSLHDTFPTGHVNLGNTPEGEAARDRATRTRSDCTVLCQQNLLLVRDTKSRWAFLTGAEPSDVPNWSDLIGGDSYIRRSPVCPSSGTYTINPLNADPSCSLSVNGGPSFDLWHVYPNPADASGLTDPSGVHRDEYPGPENRIPPSALKR